MPNLKHLLAIAQNSGPVSAFAEQLVLSGEFSMRIEPGLPRVSDALEFERIDLALIFQPLTAQIAQELRVSGYRGPIALLGSELESQSAYDTIALPVRYAVLVSRIRALIRAYAAQEDTFYSIGPFRLWPAAKNLTALDGKTLKLTEKEADILQFMHHASGELVARDVLLTEVWGYNALVSTHTLETHIYRLRQKIEQDPTQAALLVTEPGGYRLLDRAAEVV